MQTINKLEKVVVEKKGEFIVVNFYDGGAEATESEGVPGEGADGLYLEYLNQRTANPYFSN